MAPPRATRTRPADRPGGLGRPARLTEEHCEPRNKRRRLGAAERRELHRQVPRWRMAPKTLTRTWELDDFDEAFTLLRRVARLAKAEDHHPDLHLESFDHVRLRLSTHVAGGLTRNDFVLAAHIDRAARSLERPKRRRRRASIDFVPVPFVV